MRFFNEVVCSLCSSAGVCLKGWVYLAEIHDHIAEELRRWTQALELFLSALWDPERVLVHCRPLLGVAEMTSVFCNPESIRQPVLGNRNFCINKKRQRRVHGPFSKKLLILTEEKKLKESKLGPELKILRRLCFLQFVCKICKKLRLNMLIIIPY